MSTMEPEAPRKTGRPAKADADRRSATIRVGVREALRAQLEQAATVAIPEPRTLGEEIELRLENSFKLEELHKLIFGSGPAGDYLRNIVKCLMAIHDYEITPGQRIGNPDWQSSDATRAAVLAMMDVLTKEMVPQPRTSAQVAAVDPMPWTPAREDYYNHTVDYMRAMSAEMAKRLVGRSDDKLKVSDPDEASSH